MRNAPLSARAPATTSFGDFEIVPSLRLSPWKRAFDIVVCLLALPIVAVITLVMTVIVKIISPGPIFFHQERVGYLGRRFMIYKFRTMKVGADSAVHRAYCKNLIQTKTPWEKMDSRGDSRLIPGGRWFRASGLDELPQIINVLRGEMSLIGPRPCVPYEYEKFLPWQRERFSTLPGLTGLWQVSGKNRTTFEEMIQLDIHYARNRSGWLDAKILFLTPGALVQQVISVAMRKKLDLSNPTSSPAESVS